MPQNIESDNQYRHRRLTPERYTNNNNNDYTFMFNYDYRTDDAKIQKEIGDVNYMTSVDSNGIGELNNRMQDYVSQFTIGAKN